MTGGSTHYDPETGTPSCVDCVENAAAGTGFQAYSLAYRGTSTVDKENNQTSYIQSRNGNGGSVCGPSGTDTCLCSINEYTDWTNDYPYDGHPAFDTGCPGSATLGTYWTTSTITPPTTFEADACSGCVTMAYPYAGRASGSWTFTLSDEYTTDDLKAYAVASLSPYSDYSVSGCSVLAAASLASDELSYNIQAGKYKIAFQIPKVGNGSCYKITWNETFTPDTGSPVVTAKSYTWDGSIPSGYDSTDNTTWPTSDEHTVDVPSSNGSVSVTDLVAVCTGC